MADEENAGEVEQEYINASEQTERVRVYDVGGDFFLDIPSGARITFGYFNPASPRWADSGGGYGSPRPSEVARATALRVYADKTDKSQVACFLNVKGFKLDSIKLTKIVQRVTVETNLVDDGEGTIEYGAKQARTIKAIPETTGFADDETLF
jgi:hypothetical protein